MLAKVFGRDEAIVDEGMPNSRKDSPSATTAVIADERRGSAKRRKNEEAADRYRSYRSVRAIPRR